jgi:hypothetical protein
VALVLLLLALLLSLEVVLVVHLALFEGQQHRPPNPLLFPDLLAVPA